MAWVTLLAFLNGCASQALSPYASAPTPERTIPREIAVAAARFPPQAKVALLLRSKGELAASGAASGAAEGTHVLMAGLAPAGELGALVAVLLLPVFAGVGAAIGAARDAPSAASAETIESGRMSVQEGIAHLDLQRSVQARVAHELRARGVAHRVEEVHDVGPTTPDEAYAYAERDPTRQDAILEIAVLSFQFLVAQKPDSKTVHYALVMKTRSRLLAPASRAILDELHHVYRSDPHTANEWLDEGAALFSAAMRQAIEETAQGLVHEMFLLYYPAKALAAKASADAPIPLYVLRPLDPAPKRARGLRAGFIDKYMPSKSKLSFEPVDSLQPTLRWETFPRPIDVEGLDNRAERISEVRYDIELFDARRDGDFYEPDKRVYRKENLSEASHQLERPLEPCRRYFWTVRAWFKLDGWPRVTEWTGAYGALGLVKPWEYRRREASLSPRPGEGGALERLFPGVDMSDPRFHYLPFRTPAVGGASCE